MNTDRINVLFQRHDFDLDMEILSPGKVHEMGRRNAHIIGSDFTQDHVVSLSQKLFACYMILSPPPPQPPPSQRPPPQRPPPPPTPGIYSILYYDDTRRLQLYGNWLFLLSISSNSIIDESIIMNYLGILSWMLWLNQIDFGRNIAIWWQRMVHWKKKY